MRRPVLSDVSSRRSAIPCTRPVLTSSEIFAGEVVGVDLVGQLGDDEAGAALDLLDVDDGPHDDLAAAGAVGVLDAAGAHDEPAGREVRALDPQQELPEQLVVLGLGVLQQPLDAGGDLPQVVRRDVRRHADGDAGGAVDEQVREAARQDERLTGATVVVGPEIDGVLVDVPDHLHGQRREAALGVVADEAVADERVVVGVDADRPHRLDARVLHGRDRGVVEAPVDERDGDLFGLGVEPVEDLLALALPALDPVDVVPAQPVLIRPGTAAVVAQVLAEEGDAVARQGPRLPRDRERILISFSCLTPRNPI